MTAEAESRSLEDRMMPDPMALPDIDDAVAVVGTDGTVPQLQQSSLPVDPRGLARCWLLPAEPGDAATG
jgi:hypothetical protein